MKCPYCGTTIRRKRPDHALMRIHGRKVWILETISIFEQRIGRKTGRVYRVGGKSQTIPLIVVKE